MTTPKPNHATYLEAVSVKIARTESELSIASYELSLAPDDSDRKAAAEALEAELEGLKRDRDRAERALVGQAEAARRACEKAADKRYAEAEKTLEAARARTLERARKLHALIVGPVGTMLDEQERDARVAREAAAELAGQCITNVDHTVNDVLREGGFRTVSGASPNVTAALAEALRVVGFGTKGFPFADLLGLRLDEHRDLEKAIGYTHDQAEIQVRNLREQRTRARQQRKARITSLREELASGDWKGRRMQLRKIEGEVETLERLA